MTRIRRFSTYGELILLEEDDVQSPDQYGVLLAEAVRCRIPSGARACDLTTGTGFHALVLAQEGCDVVAVDLNISATLLARRNSAMNGLAGVIDVRHGDLYEALEADELFDIIVAWPPVMPTPRRRVRSDWIGVANDGGPDGRAVYDRVIAGAGAHLTDMGALWTLHPWYLELSQTIDTAAKAGLNLEAVQSRLFPMGTLSFERLDYIRSLRRLPIVRSGVPLQDITVVRLCKH